MKLGESNNPIGHAEVFGLARACTGADCPTQEEFRKTFKEIAARVGVRDGEQPTVEQLNIIWSEMNSELKQKKPANTE